MISSDQIAAASQEFRASVLALIKTSPYPQCGASGVHIGETPLPDGNGAYDQYQCLRCGHRFMRPGNEVA